jgi:hypothetical protein
MLSELLLVRWAVATESHMRTAFRVIPALLSLSGCSAPAQNEGLEHLAQALDAAWPHYTHDLDMKISVQKIADREVLHCRLTNTSANPIELNSSALPWITPGLFDVEAVTRTGGVIPRSPVVNQLMNLARPISIASGRSLEGDFDLKYMPITELPRSEDVLLLWSYGLETNGGSDHPILSGVIYLPPRSG